MEISGDWVYFHLHIYTTQGHVLYEKHEGGVNLIWAISQLSGKNPQNLKPEPEPGLELDFSWHIHGIDVSGDGVMKSEILADPRNLKNMMHHFLSMFTVFLKYFWQWSCGSRPAAVRRWQKEHIFEQ